MAFNRIKKSLKVLTLVSFLGAVFFGSFCMGMFHEKTMHAMEKVKGFSITQNGEHCCGANSVERIDLWQSIFGSTINDTRNNIALLGLTFFFFVIEIFKGSNEKKWAQKLSTRTRWLTRGIPQFQLFSPLNIAFADGILNPKTY